jgi:Lon protease-like protein
MQTRSTTEEYVELAETCLAESRRTLDRRASAMLRIMARRYLQEAERLDEVKRVPQEGTEGAESLLSVDECTAPERSRAQVGPVETLRK